MRVLIWMMLAVSAAGAAAAPQAPYGRKYDVADLGKGVYSVVWTEVIAGPVAIGNCTFIVNDDDVVVVDATTTPSIARVVIEEIKARTPKPVRYLVITHWHEDHVTGADAFLDAWPGLEIIAHPMTYTDFVEKDIPLIRNDLVEQKKRLDALAAKTDRTDRENRALAAWTKLYEEMSALRFELPTVLVNDTLTLRRGARTIDIRHLGLGNTRGDLVVHLPKEKIAITGDLAILPMQFALGSFIGPWIETLDKVAALDATTWVPGHGPVQRDRRYLTTVRDVLRTIRNAVVEGVRAGKSLEELKKTIDVPEYRKAATGDSEIAKAWYDEYFIRPAIERAYEEVK